MKHERQIEGRGAGERVGTLNRWSSQGHADGRDRGFLSPLDRVGLGVPDADADAAGGLRRAALPSPHGMAAVILSALFGVRRGGEARTNGGAMRLGRGGLLGAMLVCQSAWAAHPWTLGNVPSDYQGRYGTRHTIGIFYDPTYLQYRASGVRVKLTVPYISVVNLPVGAKLTNDTLSARGQGGGTTSASGLGDIWLATHVTVLPERGLRPAVVPYFKVKFATASVREGLGTGRNDYELGVGLDSTIGTNVFPFAHVGYRFVGSPPGLGLRNIAIYDAGVSIATSARNVVTAMYAGAQSEQAGYAGPSDAILAWNYDVTAAGSGVQVYIDKGLSHGSAGLGGGVGGQIVF